jgi:gamma-glutamyltranspeptidase/glutathione hydrolase
MKKIYIALSFLFLFHSCKTAQPVERFSGIGTKAVVVSAREEASKIGVQIMKNGGNAFDAMVATELALAVAYPYAGNLGGGGFMVFRKADGEIGTLDFRERAPMAATKDMFLDAEGNVLPGKSTDSPLSVGVPGTVAGIFEVHRKFGSMPIADIMKPVIALAEKGVIVTKKQEEQISASRPAILAANGYETLYGKTYVAGDTIKYPALAETLRRIAANGRDEFYKGETAVKLVKYLKEKGGLITAEDLEKYEPVWRKPITFKYRDLRIISMAPPSSGGICLAQIMKMIEPYNVGSLGHNSDAYIQVLAEAERRSFADRNYYLGDPDFVKIPQNELLDKTYLKRRMGDFTFGKATKSEDIQRGFVNATESTETTHYSIVDPFGNAVSVTTTLNGAYGSKLYCDELGFFLNNEMDDFSSKAGQANSYGLIGSEANNIQPGKRMLSSMTPTIVEKYDKNIKKEKLFMVLGSPGGSTIITSVLQTILNVAEFGMPMQQAVDMPRFHHQWIPDEINFEPGLFDPAAQQVLKKKGYTINEKKMPVIGKVDAILILPDGRLQSGADRRGDDAADGF